MNSAALALVARIVLAVVLLSSAVSKWRSPETTREQVVALVGSRRGPAIARELPIAELCVALALVFWWSIVPGIAAFVLFVAFTIVLVRAQQRHLPCPCFGGAVHGDAVGSSAIVRNGVLAALAVLATGSPEGAGAVVALLLA